MSTVSLSGNDTLKINDRLLTDLGTQDVGTLNFPQELASVKTGKNGNSVYAFNESGKQCDVTLKVLRGSGDDKFLSALLNSMSNNFAGFVLLTGEFIKRMGDGNGNITSDTYIMSGGIFTKQVEAKSNTEGDIEQSMSTYMLKFANAPSVS